jgi:hypothetical protein
MLFDTEAIVKRTRMYMNSYPFKAEANEFKWKTLFIF